MFRDITTLLKDPNAFEEAVTLMEQRFSGKGIQKIVGIESRGFILGAALALRLKAGFVPIRKKGKLPADTVSQEYSLEYGSDSIEMHRDAIARGDRVLIHDDLLATGGTVAAACKLVESLGGEIVGLSFLIELTFLKGRSQLTGREILSIIQYDRE